MRAGAEKSPKVARKSAAERNTVPDLRLWTDGEAVEPLALELGTHGLGLLGTGERTEAHIVRAAALIEGEPASFSKAYVLSDLSRHYMLRGER